MASKSRHPAESPYKLDSAQVSKASDALLKHIAKERKVRESQASKKNLLTAGQEDSDEEADATEVEPIQLIITTKKQIVPEKSLKPRKIPIPHTLNVDSAVSSICLITPDPQRAFKDAIASTTFPQALASKIRILGVDKLKSRYKSFEQRRQLRDEYDVFLADDRIVPMLPQAMGKVFFESSTKRPLPVSLSVRPKDSQGKTVKAEKKFNSNKRIRGEGEKEISVVKPEAFAREIEKTLSCAQIHLTPSVTTSIRVGFSTFTAEQLSENVEAVAQGVVEKYVPKGWKSVRSIFIKGLKTISLTIWQTPELWEEEEDVIEDDDAEEMKELDVQGGRKRRAIENDDRQPEAKKSKKQKLLSQDSSSAGAKESTQRRERLRQQKQEAKRAIAAGA